MRVESLSSFPSSSKDVAGKRDVSIGEAALSHFIKDCFRRWGALSSAARRVIVRNAKIELNHGIGEAARHGLAKGQIGAGNLWAGIGSFESAAGEIAARYRSAS